jgi:SanA protein
MFAGGVIRGVGRLLIVAGRRAAGTVAQLVDTLRTVLDEVSRPRREPAAHLFRTKRVVRLMGALLLIAAGSGFVADAWVRSRSRESIFQSADQVPKKHTAIVPGARVYQDGTPSAILTDRLVTALTLYRLGRVKKVLVSGDHGSESYDEVNAMSRFLEKQGVPETDIFTDHAGFRTLDTMLRAARVFGVKEAVVCTQRFHLPRSVFLARWAGIDAVGLAADQRRYRHHRINQVREFAARTVSVLDAYVLRHNPRYYGNPISICGDGRLSRDR